MVETIDTLIIGGGQAGLSVSYYLKNAGREHCVLEKSSQPGHAWRNQRWDSFTLVTPNWSFQLPGGAYQGSEPDGYMRRDEIVRLFETYAQQYQLPVRYNTTVTRVEPLENGGYRVSTPEQTYHARSVVAATGFLQEGRIPEFAAKIPASITQLHTSSYRSPQALPDGAVLVVGTGQSGIQIAEEIYQSGRRLFLATGAAPRAPRRYRGRDIFEWLYLAGFFNQSFADFHATGRSKFVPPQVTGKNGGYALNLHQFYQDGVTLLGHARDTVDGKLITGGDLQQNLRLSDGGEKGILKIVDDYIQRANLRVPEEQVPVRTDAYQAEDLPALDLRANGVTTIIWACGFQYAPSIFSFPFRNEFGYPDVQPAAAGAGLFFIGIPFYPKLKSGFLFGAAEDAARVAEQILQRA